jgi:cell shape-determining protein MreC
VIKPLDVAAKGVNSVIMVEDFSSEVEYLIDTTSKVREQKQKSKVTWNLSTDTSNGFIFPHIRCSSAMHDLQQISS